MPHVPQINVGLLGAGTVGAAVARELAARRDLLIERTGCEFRLTRALVRRLRYDREMPHAREVLTDDPAAVLEDPSIEVVIEALGGEQPAFDLLSAALRRGKRVATANKEVLARRGPELQALADRHGARLRFEAAVAAGIPLMAALRQLLPVNRVTSLRAIVNGTTNYMLTEMSRAGAGYAEALAEAQRLGFAEPDPTADVEGIDAAYKLAILASICFGEAVDPDAIDRTGITQLDVADLAYARQHGYRVKLIASARRTAAGLELSIAPTFLADADPLAGVDGALNAVEIGCDLAGPIRLVGAGAGPGPTASSLIGDAARAFRETGGGPSYPARGDAPTVLAPLSAARYMRLQTESSAPAEAALREAVAPFSDVTPISDTANCLALPPMTPESLALLIERVRAVPGVAGVTVVVEPRP